MNQQNKLKHLAIIMDGNRRWATEKGLPKFVGHTEGAKRIKPIARAAMTAGVSHLTLYALSTENLKRSEKELKHLFSLFEKLIDFIEELKEHNVCFRFIGDLPRLPEAVQKSLRSASEKTAENDGMVLTFAVAYGGRDELVRAVRSISGEITEEAIGAHLDTAGYPDVDLVIRTGGHRRLSNFLLWQTAYAELYFVDTHWPAFTEAHLQEAIDWFEAEERKGGK